MKKFSVTKMLGIVSTILVSILIPFITVWYSKVICKALDLVDAIPSSLNGQDIIYRYDFSQGGVALTILMVIVALVVSLCILCWKFDEKRDNPIAYLIDCCYVELPEPKQPATEQIPAKGNWQEA